MTKRLKIENGLHVEKKYMEWEITDFHELFDSDCKTFYTSKFSFINKLWYVEITTRHCGHNWISLFLSAEDKESIDSVTFTFGMKYLETEIKRNTLASTVYDGPRTRGIKEFCSMTELWKLWKFDSNSVTVYCHLQYHSREQFVKDAGCQTLLSQTLLCSTTALSDDFQHLLASGRHSDVTIEVCYQRFNVHKSILAARSPVFAAMFDQDMSEQNDGIVRIVDYEPDVFYYFLQYMYTGNLKYVTTNDLISLYTMADKYSVKALKETCVEIMTERLSVYNACDFLVLADQHNEAKLKKCVQEFLVKNMKKALPTNNWTSFMSKHSSMAQDILLKLFSGTTASQYLDLEDLLSSGYHGNVTFKVHGHEFKAHKCILAARSPVFAAMFGHDMLGHTHHKVSIFDCDPDTFHHFLQCMYTGNLKYISTNHLINLYTVADEYSVTDLKETCVQFMIEDLSVDNACDFLVFANKHNRIDLKHCIEEFLIKNMKKALPTNNWKSFMSKHTSMAQNILIKSYSGNS